MSIRQSIIAILDLGPCYGYQLRLEYERRTGGSVNVGQVYATLDRLERDGLATKAGADDGGHVIYRITEQGAAEARAWLGAPVERETQPRDELVTKLALAVTLPGADAVALIDAQRASTTAALARLRRGLTIDDADSLVTLSLVFAAEAELAWLDECTVIARQSRTYGLEAEPPRRGRPARLT